MSKLKTRYTVEVKMQAVRYLVDNKTTSRATSKVFGISRSRIVDFIHIELREIDEELHRNALEVLAENLKQRAYNGGKKSRRKVL